ncbi:MAG: peptidoglycan-binding protein [Hyphomicrobiales bacterium]|nr:peptidoglycan-binding protein [Hyphomicrobiales bacterium]
MPLISSQTNTGCGKVPEALARADFDFTVQERPQRPRAAQGQKRSAARYEEPGLAAQIMDRLLAAFHRNKARNIVTLGLCGFAGIFMLNALWLQHGHRHALDLPLYHQAPAAVLPKPRIPLPPTRPAVAAPVATPASLPMLAPLPPVQPSSGALLQGDGINRLLGQGLNRPSAPDHSARTLAVQQALAKLGYKVTADGVYGRTTRGAIAEFEHAAKLPETGNMGLRMRAALAKRAGMTIP